MDSVFWLVLAACCVVCLVSQSGALLLWMGAPRLMRWIPFLLALAAGVLLGDAFLHLIPEAQEQFKVLAIQGIVEQSHISESIGALLLIGILLFFLMERWVRTHQLKSPQTVERSLGPMSLVGDAFHNFLDGCLLAGAFLLDPSLGFLTLVAIVAHELPQELGDFGALIHSGIPAKKALFRNFLASLTCPFGAVLALAFGAEMQHVLAALIPLAAGGFIYIAVAVLIPALHSHQNQRLGFGQIAVLVLGLALMWGVGFLEMSLMGGHG
jgi:zinc and cadmium transporter